MTLDYIYHSGFAIEAEGVTVIIDYYKDSSETEHNRGIVHDYLLQRPGKLYVLATHFHPDHFNREILTWKEARPDIRYIFSKDILKSHRGKPEDATYIKKGETYEDETIRIEAFGSTDVGSSFLIHLQDWNIFHAGDLNNWHWSEESTEAEIRKANGDFRTENHGTGILFESTNTDCSIKNVIGINLKLGFDIRKATRMQISDCWVCEMESSIKLQGGEQNSVKNCQLGAQPKGITCMFAKEKNLVFEKNQVYPDGSSNLVLDECDDAKISNNNFKSYYIGILNMSGNRNKVENNIFWMADAVANQLLDRGAEYGVVCIAGEENHFIQNTLTCEWIVENGVTVRATEGKNNLIENCLIENTNSNQVLLVNDQMKVLNCVPKDKIKIEQQD